MGENLRKYFYSILIFIFFVGLITNVSTARASDNELLFSQEYLRGSAEECYGIDLILIIDQSASMSIQTESDGLTFDPNDPNGRRIEAVFHAMDWLASNRLSLCTDVVHRVGVVGFGTDAKVYIPLRDGIIKPDSHEDWSETFNRFRREVYSENLGHTSTKRGFEVARELFSEAGEIGDAPRKKIMIMITDGQPRPLGREATIDAILYYMNEMKDYIRKHFDFDESIIAREEAIDRAIVSYGSLDRIPVDVKNNLLIEFSVPPEAFRNSFYVYFLAMNDASAYLNTIGKSFEEISETHGGKLIDLVDNEISVLTTINQILSRVTGLTSTVVDCEPIAVLPYLSSVTLDFYKLSSAIEVTIALDSHKLSNGGDLFGGEGDSEFWGVEGFSSYGATEHYLFRQPPGGIWKFQTDVCRDIKASFRAFKPEILVEESNLIFPHYPSSSEKYDPINPHYFRFYIEDSITGIPLVNDEAFPIDMSADILMPGGERERVTFTFDPDDLYWISSPVPVFEKGTASFTLTGQAECVGYPSEHCPEPVFSIVSWQNEYIIGEVDPIVWLIAEPVDGSTSELNGPPLALPLLPLLVEIEVYDKDDMPFSIHDWINPGENVHDAFTAKLVLPDGEIVTKSMSPRTNDPSKFFTTFEFDDESKYVQGIYNLEVSMKDVWQRDKYFSEQTKLSVSFTKQNSLFRTHLFWNIIKTLLGVIFVAILGKIIYDHTNVVTGNLVFSNTSLGDKNISLAKKKRRIVINKHPILKELNLRRIIVQNNQRSASSGSVPILVILERDDKRQTQMTLSDTKVGRYSDSNNNSWQLSYTGGKKIKKTDKRRRTSGKGPQRRPRI